MQSIEIQSKGKNCSVAKISEFFGIFWNFLDFFGFFWIFFEFFRNFRNFLIFYGIVRKFVRFARPPEDYSPMALRAPTKSLEQKFCKKWSFWTNRHASVTVCAATHQCAPIENPCSRWLWTPAIHLDTNFCPPPSYLPTWSSGRASACISGGPWFKSCSDFF